MTSVSDGGVRAAGPIAAGPPPGPAPLAIVGPTASGKSAAAMALAAALAPRLPVEIISVDSALVYRGMDIGTAKPSEAERAAVPHHGIDIIEPTQSWSAAQFATDARRLIGEIRARGALPLLVGGTMLYLKALREGLDTMPAADPAVRRWLDTRAVAEGWPALHAELMRVDPVTARRLQPRDAQRIQRALEVWHQTGRPLSDYHGRREPAGADAGAAAAMDIPVVALEPADRAWLHARITQRFDQMLAAGLLDEVRRLRARGDLHPGLPSMRCVGYRQAWQTLDDGVPDGAARHRLREAGIAATRQLAKRQLTWLRAMPDREVLAPDRLSPGDLLQRLLALVPAAAAHDDHHNAERRSA